MNVAALPIPFITSGSSPQEKNQRRQQLYELLKKDNEILGDILELQRKLSQKKETRALADEVGEIVQEFLSLNRQKLELTDAISKEK